MFLFPVQSILERSTLSPNAKEFIPLSKCKISQLSSSGTNSNEVEIYPSNCSSSFLDTQEDSVLGSNDKENNDQMTASNGCKERLDDNVSYATFFMCFMLKLEQFAYTDHVLCLLTGISIIYKINKTIINCRKNHKTLILGFIIVLCIDFNYL